MHDVFKLQTKATCVVPCTSYVSWCLLTRTFMKDRHEEGVPGGFWPKKNKNYKDNKIEVSRVTNRIVRYIYHTYYRSENRCFNLTSRMTSLYKLIRPNMSWITQNVKYLLEFQQPNLIVII